MRQFLVRLWTEYAIVSENHGTHKFIGKIMSDFFQTGPEIGNQYLADSLLQSTLQRMLPQEMLQEIEPDLKNFGHRVVTDIWAMAQDAEANQPRLVQYDPWGRRIDRVEISRGWTQLDAVAAEEGLLAIAYERKYGALSRIYQMAKFYLFHASSAFYSCPVSATDGAARVIELFGNQSLKDGAFRRLISRDPKKFWTSGQWMTERRGGSDVGNATDTIARFENGTYRLYGVKWFTSVATAQMSITLARIEDDSGSTTPGTRGLSLFFIETFDSQGNRSGHTLNRLKDKLGSKALPTAEITLDGIPAMLLGVRDKGIKNIAQMLKITRLGNSGAAISAFRRGLALARDYAYRREAFGKTLANQALHVETLAELEVEFSGAFLLTFYLAELVGKEECGEATSEESKVLRVLTPIAKLFTAKQATRGMSEIIECFGGAGYIEDTGIPRHLRDVQLLPIWEGTTNVVSLDVIRAIQREDALPSFLNNLDSRLAKISTPELSKSAELVRNAVKEIHSYVERSIQESPEYFTAGARCFAFSLARAFGASLLLEHADWASKNGGENQFSAIANRWCQQKLVSMIHPDPIYLENSKVIALGKLR